MRKSMTAFAAIFMFVATLAISTTFTGCAASKAEISQATNACDIMVEVRTLGKDSVSWFAGNTMYLNANLAKRERMFPMFISTRSPANIDVQRRIDQIRSPEELISFFARSSAEPKSFGIVFSDLVRTDAGVDEQKTVETLKSVFQSVSGVSLVLFHEKDGNISDMKKIL